MSRAETVAVASLLTVGGLMTGYALILRALTRAVELPARRIR